MRKFAIGLWTAQIVATIAMLIAATIATESILITGPILGITGLSLALVTQPLQSWSTLSFTLSAPLVGALIALMIAVFDMNPREGHAPTIAILTVDLVVTSPLAFMSFRRIRRWQTVDAASEPPVFQFSMKAMLILMTAVCLMIGLFRSLHSDAFLDETFIFASYALVVGVLSSAVTWRNLRYPFRGDRRQ